MGLGERLRFLRCRTGKTQKWLGEAVGFPKKTADIRIAQYESGSRTPKEDVVVRLASVLGVSKNALQIPDLCTEMGVVHALFVIEDLYGAKVEEKDGKICILFDGTNPILGRDVYDALILWNEKAVELRAGRINREQYDDWRYNL